MPSDDRPIRWIEAQTRRYFLQSAPVALGGLAAASWLGTSSRQSSVQAVEPASERGPQFGQAKRVISIHLAGSPSQLDLFDYKPKLNEHNDKPCPQEFLDGARFAFIKGHPQLLGTPHRFAQHGESGTWMSDQIPNLAKIADDLTIVRSLVTDQFNHAPAQLYLQTGNARLGYPSMGSWVTYGLGSENENLPGFVVFVSGGKTPDAGKSVWGSGFLPGVYQGVQCRSAGEPILYLADPPGMTREARRRHLDAVGDLNAIHFDRIGDPEITTRIKQFELAYRMQASVPGVMEIGQETAATLEAYGAVPGQASFANNCLLARRLVEQGVRFVQLYDWGWDAHGTGKHDDLMHQMPKKCQQTDRPVAALIADLKQRGLLDETLVIWGGEFGRTSMNEKRNGSTFLGRDHHPHAFTMFFAGGGMKPGLNFGQTDELGYHVAQGKVTVRDLQATILHLVGLDPYSFSYPFQGLDQRLIGPTHEGQVRFELLA